MLTEFTLRDVPFQFYDWVRFTIDHEGYLFGNEAYLAEIVNPIIDKYSDAVGIKADQAHAEVTEYNSGTNSSKIELRIGFKKIPGMDTEYPQPPVSVHYEINMKRSRYT